MKHTQQAIWITEISQPSYTASLHISNIINNINNVIVCVSMIIFIPVYSQNTLEGIVSKLYTESA